MGKGVNIGFEIERLLNYGLYKSLIDPADVPLIRNELMDLLKVRAAYTGDADGELESPSDILNNVLLYCFETKILPDNTITRRDLLSSMLMGKITPLPSVVAERFNALYQNAPAEATDYLYRLSCDVNFIHTARAKKNVSWSADEKYGVLELTINFQSPGKTEAEIEAQNNSEKTLWPKCARCAENVGYKGDLWRNAGYNMRVVPIVLNGRCFYLQYPPEQHYIERCFLAYEKHEPHGGIDKSIETMLAFVDMFPHYFMGFEASLHGLSNVPAEDAEHEHYMGGCNVLPVEYAEIAARYRHDVFHDVEVAIINWPVSIIRLECGDAWRLKEAAASVVEFWEDYTDEDAGIFAQDDNVRHNSVGIVARKNAKGCFEIDIVLRNNSDRFMDRPDSRLADSAVGLSEAMGIAVYPESFDGELLHIMGHIMSGRKYEKNSTRDVRDRHADWMNELVDKYGAIDSYAEVKNVVTYEVGRRFAQTLERAGVFKPSAEGLRRFKGFMEEMGLLEIGE